MKKDGRTKLLVRKQLPSGHLDRFTVIVATKDVADAKRMYESMGYKVLDM